MADSTHITLDTLATLLPGLMRGAPAMMHDAWNAHGAAITAETAAMADARDRDPIRHAQAALAFAILSPGNKLDKNARQARRVVDCIEDHFDAVDALYQCVTDACTDQGGRSTGPNVRSLHRSLDYLRNLETELMTKPALQALRKRGVIIGIGEKTASMAAALYDIHAPVFTLDVHMLRWVCIAAGRPELAVGTMTIADTAYRQLEATLVALAAAAVPNVATFAVQWACWNVVSDGEHRTHLGIFGLD